MAKSDFSVSFPFGVVIIRNLFHLMSVHLGIGTSAVDAFTEPGITSLTAASLFYFEFPILANAYSVINHLRVLSVHLNRIFHLFSIFLVQTRHLLGQVTELSKTGWDWRTWTVRRRTGRWISSRVRWQGRHPSQSSDGVSRFLSNSFSVNCHTNHSKPMHGLGKNEETKKSGCLPATFGELWTSWVYPCRSLCSACCRRHP